MLKHRPMWFCLAFFVLTSRGFGSRCSGFADTRCGCCFVYRDRRSGEGNILEPTLIPGLLTHVSCYQVLSTRHLVTYARKLVLGSWSYMVSHTRCQGHGARQSCHLQLSQLQNASPPRLRQQGKSIMKLVRQ